MKNVFKRPGKKIIVLIFSICFSCIANAQSTRLNKTLEISIVQHSYMRMAFTEVIVTPDELIAIARRGGTKDSIVFATKLQLSDTLQWIKEIRLADLETYYSNNCIDDGSVVSVLLKKDNETKSVILYNYYHPDMGMIIYFVNARLPKQYQIWYDKKKLLSDYANCETIHQFRYDTNKIVIFNLDKLTAARFLKAKATNLTKEELSNVDKILRVCVDSNNAHKNGDTQFPTFIDLQKYRIQYVPYIDSNGEKKVYVNCFCGSEKDNPNWKKTVVEWDDGGICFFQLTINVTRSKLEYFSTNGYG